MTSTAIAAYLALFVTVGFLFVLACLLLGAVVRARVPNSEKLATYECGEPAVGPSSVQFDLRFYVVALLFLIFEVEVAFFFPPAIVFGKAVRQMESCPAGCVQTESAGTTDAVAAADAVEGAPSPAAQTPATLAASKLSPRALARTAMLDLGVFFAVLLVGFAYVWRQGDLDWVRAVRHPDAKGDSPIFVNTKIGTVPNPATPGIARPAGGDARP